MGIAIICVTVSTLVWGEGARGEGEDPAQSVPQKTPTVPQTVPSARVRVVDPRQTQTT